MSQRLVTLAILLWESAAIYSGCRGNISCVLGCILSADIRGALCSLLSDMGLWVGRMGEVLATDVSSRLGDGLSQQSVALPLLMCSLAAAVSDGCGGISRVLGRVI